MNYLRTLSSFLLSTCFIGSAFAESELTVSYVETVEDSGDYYALVNIALSNSEMIKTMGFDIITPQGVTELLLAECVEKSRAQKKQGLKYSDVVNLGYASHEGYGSLTVTPVATDGISSGEMADVFTLTFALDGDHTFTENDFFFNNVSSVSMETDLRDEIKFPIGKLGSNGYSTYSSTQDIVISGATAYYGSFNDDNTAITLNEVSGAIKNNQGVVLQGTEGEVVYGTSVETADAPAENILKPSFAENEVSDVLVLSTKNGETGFYKFSGTKMRAGKAYIDGTSPLRIVTETTGIEAIETEQNIDTIFNLQGQKQQEIKSGINIVNGKKVMY